MLYDKLSSFILSLLAPKMEAGRCFITFVSTYQTASIAFYIIAVFSVLQNHIIIQLSYILQINMIEGGYCDQQSPCLSDVSFTL